MIVTLIRSIVGTVLVLFVPGYMSTRLLFDQLELAPLIGLSVGLSMAMITWISFMLTILSIMSGSPMLTAGLSLAILISISALLGVVHLWEARRCIR
jgi:uncharacterized membrane protein